MFLLLLIKMNISFKELCFRGAYPQENIPDNFFYIGWDSEFDPNNKLVCTQFYLKNIFLTNPNQYSFIKDLISIRLIPSFGTVLIFDDSQYIPGIDFCTVFSQRLLYVQQIIDPVIFERIVLCTFYSNAEISALFPTISDLRELKIAQNDTVAEKKHPFQKDYNNLTCTDILGTVKLTNYKFNLPFSVDVIDAKHIYSQTDLKGLGSTLKINKMSEIDFESKNASQWLHDDPELFLDYSAIDAVIPLESILNMHSCKNQLFKRLSELLIVPTLETTSSKRFLNKRFTTTAGIADSLIFSVIEKQDVKQQFLDFQKWEAEKLPFQATKTKGGLNKVYIDTPKLIQHVDQFDISGAYATAMREFKLPLSEPQIVGSHFTILKDLAIKVDSHDVEYAVFNLVYEIPEDANEWERPLIIFDYFDDVGFTGTKTDRNQWFTIYEILTLASIWPNINVEVIQGYVWTKERTQHSVSLKELYSQLKSLRKEYKNLGEQGDAMQTTIKLIGNAGYGKTLQNKNVLNPKQVDTSILTNRSIDRDLHSMLAKSKIYSSVWGNAITGLIRAVVAITAWKNKAYMSVTDSIICDTGTFIPSKEIKTSYYKLNFFLSQVEWECDYQDVNFFIVKERDYFSFTIKDNVDNSIIYDIEKGLADESIVDKLNILKAAKRGFKSLYKDRKMKNIDFAKKSIRRLLGTPIHFTEKTLIKYKDFLMKSQVLNQTKFTEKQLGSENIRYYCNTIQELQKRIRIKEKCRRKGFADGLDCKLQNKDVYDDIVSKTKSYQRQPNIKIPQNVKIAIFQMLDLNYSLRYIEAFLKKISLDISKSTLHRWYQKYKDSSTSFIDNKYLHKQKRCTIIGTLKLSDLSFDHPIRVIIAHVDKQRLQLPVNDVWSHSL